MPRDYIFISYSHRDEKWLDRLRIFLKPFQWGQSYKDGGRVWADPYIRTGERWRREIGDGLARARVAVLLVSQDFLASEFIGSNEIAPALLAAQTGELVLVCVPVRSSIVDLVHPELLEFQWPRPHNQPLDLLVPAAREAALAQIFRSLHEIAKATGLTEFAAPTRATGDVPAGDVHPIASLSRSGALGELVGVPAQRPHHIPRLDIRDRIRRALLAGSRSAVGLTGAGANGSPRRVGVFGQGGLGKTVSAIDLVHDEDVRRAFPGGIYWLTLGQSPDLVSLQATLVRQITGDPAVVESVAGGSRLLRELVANRACLIVLDDVWRADHARAFDVLGERSRLLTTTRDATLLIALGAENIELDVLSDTQALALLATWTNQPVAALPSEARSLVKRCGYLPLAISVAGAMVRDGTAWDVILDTLNAGNLRFLDHPYANVFALLRLSVDALPEHARTRYLELAVAPDHVPLPVRVVTRLWAHTGDMEEYEGRRLLANLERKALLYLEGEVDQACMRFHDLQRDFLQLAVDDVGRLHGNLLDAFTPLLQPSAAASHRAWWTLPDDERYLWLHLAHHLTEGDRRDELGALLLDYDWISAKLRVTDITALLRDYETVAGNSLPDAYIKDLHLVQRALLQSAHILSRNPEQLASQLVGRLISPTRPEIASLVASAERSRTGPSLHPLLASLAQADTGLVRTLERQGDWVYSVALSGDGRWIVSSIYNGRVDVWDTETGQRARMLIPPGSGKKKVAVSWDGRWIVSGRSDEPVEVWDRESGQLVRRLEESNSSSGGVAVSGDGCWIVSGAEDGVVKVWERESGKLVHTLVGHAGFVTAVAVSGDGQWIASASYDGVVKMWERNQESARTLDRLRTGVFSVAVSSDGRWVAFAGGEDRTVAVWDRDSGRIAHTSEGHDAAILAVAVSADGQWIVSGAKDQTVRVWERETGQLARTFEGHGFWVQGVAVSTDGRWIVSGSWDETVKMWDRNRGQPARTAEGHRAQVNSIAVSTDGRWIISGSSGFYDRSVKVWDQETGQVAQSLERDGPPIRAMAASGDGRWIAEGSKDGTVRVWDRKSGLPPQILEGHRHAIRAVAVSSDGQCVVSASYEDRTVKVWNRESGQLAWTLEGHDHWVESLAASADGRWIVSGSMDNTVKVWDQNGRQLARTLAGHTSGISAVAVSGDGQCIVSGSFDKTVKVWDRQSERPPSTLIGHADVVLAVAVSGNGRWIISGARDHTIRLWNGETGELLDTFTVDADVSACALTPDARCAVAGDWAGRIHYFSLLNLH